MPPLVSQTGALANLRMVVNIIEMVRKRMAVAGEVCRRNV